MIEPFDPAPAAALLAAAWRSGEQLTELPASIRPANLAQGYAVQDRMLAALGQEAVGWKLGVGSTALKRQSGAGRSIAGRVLRSNLHRAGDSVTLPNAAPVTMEFEIAYLLARDILPDEPDFPVLEAVGETRVAFELVLSRFVDRRAVGWPSFTADNAGFQSLVLGPVIDPNDIPALIASLAVSVDGEPKAAAATGDDTTDPATALADLVALARERGTTLPEGSIISTGAASKPFNLAAATAEITARFLSEAVSFHTLVGQGNTP